MKIRLQEEAEAKGGKGSRVHLFVMGKYLEELQPAQKHTVSCLSLFYLGGGL